MGQTDLAWKNRTLTHKAIHTPRSEPLRRLFLLQNVGLTNTSSTTEVYTIYKYDSFEVGNSIVGESFVYDTQEKLDLGTTDNIDTSSDDIRLTDTGSSGTWTSESRSYPMAWGSVIWTSSTSSELGCFRSGDVSDWTETANGTLDITIDTSGKLEGDNSAKLVGQANSSGESVYIEAEDSFDQSDYDQIEIYVMCSITGADLFNVYIKNNGSYSLAGTISISSADTAENKTISLSGFTHDDVEGFKLESNTNTAFTAYFDRIVFTDSAATPWKTISWTVDSQPANTDIQVNILDASDDSTLVSDVSSGADISDLITADTNIKIEVVLTPFAGSGPVISDMTIDWIGDRIGDRAGEEVQVV